MRRDETEGPLPLVLRERAAAVADGRERRRSDRKGDEEDQRAQEHSALAVLGDVDEWIRIPARRTAAKQRVHEPRQRVREPANHDAEPEGYAGTSGASWNAMPPFK